MKLNLAKLQKSKSFLALLLSANALCGCATPVAKTPETPFVLLVRSESQSDLQWNALEAGSADIAKKIMLERMGLLDRLVKPEIDPYGVKSMNSPCLKSPPPTPQSGSDRNGSWMLRWLYASPDRVLGACSSPQTALKTQYLLLYCPSQQSVYIVRSFAKPEMKWTLTPTARCR